ncbi:MAG TPA: ABC transporter ATP-binding protein [Thermomicrobiales bacterium]|nr:ABC transporter ATP-binding protein [Thermomicrobiales bacterium]
MAAMFVHIETRLKTFMLSVTLEVEDELLALTGPPGAGKSVVLRSIAGVYAPDSGLISVRDRAVFSTGLGVNLPPTERHIGYVQQANALFPHLTAAENIAYPLQRQSGPGSRDVGYRVDLLIDLLGLDHQRDLLPEGMSDYHRHTVAIARSLALDPDVLLLDDPFSALDAVTRRQVRGEFAELRRRIGVPAVLATGEMEEAYEIADRIALMERGAILQVDSPQRLMNRPANRRVADLIQSVNVIRGKIVSVENGVTRVWTAFGILQIDEPSGSEVDVEVVVRPEHVRLRMSRGDEADVTNVIRGRITDETLHGSTHSLIFAPHRSVETDDRPETLQVYVDDLAYQRLGGAVRGECEIELPSQALHMMPFTTTERHGDAI